MVDHPPRTTKHRRLGKLLLHQLPNTTQAPLITVFTFRYYPEFNRINRAILTFYSPIRYSNSLVCVQLACVRHTTSIHSEPESNSILRIFILILYTKPHFPRARWDSNPWPWRYFGFQNRCLYHSATRLLGPVGVEPTFFIYQTNILTIKLRALEMMGLEPTPDYGPDPKSDASTNSATSLPWER